MRVSGEDAKLFLQGLITNDVEHVDAGQAIHAGLLTAQGKILFDFFVVGQASDYLIECPLASISDLAKRLTFYKLRATVDIEDVSDSHVVAVLWGPRGELPASAINYTDPRLAELGQRAILGAEDDLATIGCTLANDAAYHARRISHGVPEGGRDFEYGDTFPHEADFDQLNGIDFDKGCYVGQEVVSRMQHRGTARKRVVPIEAEAALPAPGAEVVASGAHIGRLGSVAEKSGLALLRLDRAEKARGEGKAITAGDVAITLRQPAWASFEVSPKDQDS